MTLKKCVYASNSMMCAERKSKTGATSKRKEKRMDKKVVETINALCDWVKNELENIDGNDKESIMPEMIEALTELIKAYRGY